MQVFLIFDLSGKQNEIGKDAMVLNPKSETLAPHASAGVLNPKFVLALDLGTSSVRAMLFDANARAVPGIEKQEKFEVRTTPDGGHEIDADEMLGYAESVIDDVLAKSDSLAIHIAALASDSLVSNILGVDEHGRAVTPVFTYADTRNARQVDELRAKFDEHATHQRVGTMFHSSYLPA